MRQNHNQRIRYKQNRLREKDFNDLTFDERRAREEELNRAFLNRTYIPFSEPEDETQVEPEPEPQGNGAASPNLSGNGAKPRGPKVVYECASEIPLEPIEWLWSGRLAKGKHTMIAGDPGVGKSQVAIYAIAQATTGGEWPCKEGRAPVGNVIILSAEDGAGDTILPRLHAAGADCGRIYIIKAVTKQDGSGRGIFNLKVDLTLLERTIAEIGDVVLVVIDTVNSYLGNTDTHKGVDVRSVLDPLSEMADRTRIAVLWINHLNKGPGTSQTKVLYRFLGSIAFSGAPRIALAALEDPEDEDRVLFLHAKNNLAARPQGLAYRVKQTIVGDQGKAITTSKVEWENDPVSMTADTVIAADYTGGYLCS